MLVDKDLEEVLAQIIQHTPLLPSKDISIMEALGRVCAEDVHADNNLPEHRQSAVDGYAVAYSEENSFEQYKLTGHIDLGDVPETPLKPGEAIGVVTGGYLPEGAVAVVPHEKTEVNGNLLRPLEIIKKDNNIKQAGEDYKKDDLLIGNYQVIGPGEIGLLAAFGKSMIKVYDKPKVAVLSLSNNIVSWQNVPEPGQIRDSNGPLLSALVMQNGGEIHSIEIAAEDKNLLKDTILGLVKQTNIIILTGGTYSEGDNEVISLLKDLGAKMLYWGVPIQPGSHTGAALLDSCLIFALSGNPASCAVGYYLYVAPALKGMQGLNPYWPRVKAKCTNGFPKKTGTRRFVRGYASFDKDGWKVTVQPGQKPSMIRSLIGCNALIDLPANNPPVEPGEEVEILLLNKFIKSN